MNDIEQQQFKMFCTIFVILFTMVVLLAALGSFGVTG